MNKITHQAHIIRVFIGEQCDYSHYHGYIQQEAGLSIFVAPCDANNATILPFRQEDIARVIIYRKSTHEISAHIILSIDSPMTPAQARKALAEELELNMRSYIRNLSFQYDRAFKDLNNQCWIEKGTYLTD